MISGAGFTVGGHTACRVHGDRLVVRLGPDRYQGALSHDEVSECDVTGRGMPGWVMVAPEGITEDRMLRPWVRAGWDCA